jgi:hypothetical protein
MIFFGRSGDEALFAPDHRPRRSRTRQECTRPDVIEEDEAGDVKLSWLPIARRRSGEFGAADSKSVFRGFRK